MNGAITEEGSAAAAKDVEVKMEMDAMPHAAPPEEPNFDRAHHICAATPDAEAMKHIAEFRQMLERNEDLYDEDWATDEQLYRCLIAKQYNKEVALNLATEALKWRKKRAPHLIENTEGWQRAFELESETGKIYNPGSDKWGRPIIVFDNGAANTTNIDAQMLFLGWALNFACREMPKNVDKYHIFMHLESFSFFSIPPLSATTETIHMLCNTFPERLGHCIAYRPPGLFKTFFSSVKPFIDPKTAAKMVFITGDVSDGSANDKLLSDLIGPNWKVLTGAEQPILQKTKPASSPGYLHAKQWPALMKRVEIVQERERRELALKPKKEPKAIAPVAPMASRAPSLADATSPMLDVPEMYNEDEDHLRTTYSSQHDFNKALQAVAAANAAHQSQPKSPPFLARSPDSDGIFVTLFLLVLENFFYLLEDVVAFRQYISHVVDSFLGPSTAPTKTFIRLTLVSFRIFHGGTNQKMKNLMYIYVLGFAILYFLMHDLRGVKKDVVRFAEKHAI